MTLSTKAILAAPALAVAFFALQGLRWAANTWGVEAVGVCLALPVLAIPVLSLCADRAERKRDAEPWVEIPSYNAATGRWELKR